MTTIVYRDGVMAADTAIFDRDCYCGEMIKIFRSPDGSLGGVAGCAGDLAIFRDWFIQTYEGVGVPHFKDEDSEGLIIRPDGSVLWVGFGGKIVPVVAPYQAIGSGFRIAMGALAAGVSASRAVEIAAGLDAHTRAPVIQLNLKD